MALDNQNSTRTRIKYCGITNEQDLLDAVKSGADALGFVFVDASPRSLAINDTSDCIRIKQLLSHTPAFVSNVALVVNPNTEKCQHLKELPIDLYQFHGDESPEFCHKTAGNKRWVKAIQVKPELNLLEHIQCYVDAGASGILLDGYDPKRPTVTGGTGKSFDWTVIKKLTNKVDCPIILAGGLTAENVANAIKTAQPFAVDVSGGIEKIGADGKAIKGKKDVILMQQFAQAVLSCNNSIF